MIGLQMIHEMGSLQREMEQIFRGLGFNSMSEDLPQATQFKLGDNGEAFEVEAMLPGLDIDKLDISMLGRRLTLSGEFVTEDAPEGATWHRRERQGGRFEKSLQLSANVDAERVKAEYLQGVLRVTLPRAPSALPKKISVQTA
jgi:HSP20 family protein